LFYVFVVFFVLFLVYVTSRKIFLYSKKKTTAKKTQNIKVSFLNPFKSMFCCFRFWFNKSKTISKKQKRRENAPPPFLETDFCHANPQKLPQKQKAPLHLARSNLKCHSKLVQARYSHFYLLPYNLYLVIVFAQISVF